MIPDAIDLIIHHLLQHNFLNEARFAQAFARGKFRTKKWGKTRIIRELKMRDISEFNLKLALKEIPEDEYLTTFYALAEKRFEQLASEKNIQKKEKNGRLSPVSRVGIRFSLGGCRQTLATLFFYNTPYHRTIFS